MLETSLYRLVEDAHPVESRSNDATAPSNPQAVQM